MNRRPPPSSRTKPRPRGADPGPRVAARGHGRCEPRRHARSPGSRLSGRVASCGQDDGEGGDFRGDNSHMNSETGRTFQANSAREPGIASEYCPYSSMASGTPTPTNHRPGPKFNARRTPIGRPCDAPPAPIQRPAISPQAPDPRPASAAGAPPALPGAGERRAIRRVAPGSMTRGAALRPSHQTLRVRSPLPVPLRCTGREKQRRPLNTPGRRSSRWPRPIGNCSRPAILSRRRPRR